jgi:hypothetical protein
MVYLPVPGKALIQTRGAGRVQAMLDRMDEVNANCAVGFGRAVVIDCACSGIRIVIVRWFA